MAVAGAALLLAGCGLHPLYGTSAVSGSVAESLASITIPEPETRLTQLIRNNLLSTMRPAGQAGPSRYVLQIHPHESGNDQIVQPQPQTRRQEVVVTIDYQLTENSRTLTQGKSFSRVSYDVVRQPFSDQQAQTDAEKRAALELSDDIRTRLAAYFSTH